jgi:multidrug resistance efflux pump
MTSRQQFIQCLLKTGILLTLVLLVVGCTNTNLDATPTSKFPGQDQDLFDFALTADGKLTPRDWVQLSFTVSGSVSEVIVQVGDTVKVGDALARLGNHQAAKAALAAAEMELLLADQVHQALYELLEAEQQQALQSLYLSRQSAKDAEQQLEYWEGSLVEIDAELANAQVILAESDLGTAQSNFEEYEDRDPDDSTRLRSLEELANAQLTYDNALTRYNSLINAGKEFNLEQARTALLLANTQLELAEDKYNKLLDGPDPDALSTAEARLQAAQAQLEAAEANLEAMTLRAVMDGEVMEVRLKVGEQVAMGIPVVWLADLSQWVVETDNLTEIDVVEVVPGQSVTIVIDALAEITFSGEVLSIDRLYQEKRGDITYTARILMDGSDTRIRWGMTCAITFTKP